MNKLKFVLLAASVMLAMAFTLSCSGDDGKDGKTPEIEIGANGNWFIDGVDTGVNAQGKDGTDGTDGTDGSSGSDATSCSMVKTNLGVNITCGSDVISIPHFCNSVPYNSDEKLCFEDNLYGIVKIGTQLWMSDNLKGGTGNNNDQFTWAEATAAGLCPTGWSLPSKEDFEVLIEGEDLDEWSGTGSWWSTDEYINPDDDDDDSLAYRFNNGTLSEFAKASKVSIRCLK